jgi:hypothetical protein
MSTTQQIARCFTFSDAAAIRLVSAVGSVRSVNPAGAAVIFAVAYLAGAIGSLAVLLIAAALFAGLYSARIAARPAHDDAASLNRDVESARVASGPQLPLAMDCFGLPVSEIKFKAPTASKARKAPAA